MRRRDRLRSPLWGAALAAPAALTVAAACSDPPPPFEDGTSAGPDATAPVDASVDAVPAAPPRRPYDAGGAPSVPRVPVVAEVVSTRADVAALMFAAGEMQISGEPFASTFAGRDLAEYDRTFLPTDQYIVGIDGDDPKPMTDLFGFSTVVESYEYSKYHMNMVAQQSTAGLSLAVGPVVARRAEATPLERLRARTQEIILAAGTDVAGFAVSPAPTDNALNYLGFQGLWPTFAPFTSFDPAMKPNSLVIRSCTFAGGYGGSPTQGSTTPEYECAYNSLHLLDRDAQVEKTLSPGTLGLATWKEALWSIDFVGRLHDANSMPVDAVRDEDRAQVGVANNTVKGASPASASPGTFIGSNPLEGMWGLLMLEEMQNEAELLTSALTTSDGASLGGFASRADAVAYDYTSPLRWFPATVAVTEDQGAPYPGVKSLAITDAASHAEDLAALLLGHAMLFGMTDARNVGIGQRLGLRLTFDGAPFPADDGLAGGEDTAHDRALAVLRVALVDLDRMHVDPALGVVVDEAHVDRGAIVRGDTVTTTSLAHTVIALRQTLLALNGAITQYGAADPDPGADAKGILNAFPIHPTGAASPSFSARVRSLLVQNARFVLDVLTDSDGSVRNGATLAGGAANGSTDAPRLESQAAALRALVEAFLVTGDEAYRTRARLVARRLEAAFYAPAARLYRGEAAGKDEVHMTPARFAWLQSALREAHKTLHVPGDPALGRDVLEDRIARVNKLFLNGWDDRDGDQKVDTAHECLAGRLQLAEQALTGELGRDDIGNSTSDRDSDCVPEIDDAQLGSVLAREVWVHTP